MTRYYVIEDGRLTSWTSLYFPAGSMSSHPLSRMSSRNGSGRIQYPVDFLMDALDVDERARYEREDDIRLVLVNTPMLNDIDKENEAIYITAPIGIILTAGSCTDHLSI